MYNYGIRYNHRENKVGFIEKSDNDDNDIDIDPNSKEGKVILLANKLKEHVNAAVKKFVHDFENQI